MEIMFFSIFSGIFYRFLGFTCVLLLAVCELNVNLHWNGKKGNFRLIFQNIVHSANRNLASYYDRNIILSPL